MTEALAPYRRFLAALLGTIATTLMVAMTDDVVTSPEVVMLATAALGLITTYTLPDTQVVRYMKLVANAVLNGLGLLGAWLAAGQDITTSMKIQLVIAVATGLGLMVVKNDTEPAVPPTSETPPLAA